MHAGPPSFSSAHLPEREITVVGEEVRLPVGEDIFTCSWIQRWRQEFAGGRTPPKSPLAKAVGLKKDHPLVVWDVTCGLGLDSLHLLGLGAQVVAFERSPVMQKMILANLALLSPQADGPRPPWEKRGGKFTFYPRDFIQSAEEVLSPGNTPDVLYLDPMFGDEGRQRKALPKKEMQILPQIVGLDEDAPVLWQAVVDFAQKVGAKRLVVKRALHAPPLGAVDFAIKGKAVRFDVKMMST